MIIVKRCDDVDLYCHLMFVTPWISMDKWIAFYFGYISNTCTEALIEPSILNPEISMVLLFIMVHFVCLFQPSLL